MLHPSTSVDNFRQFQDLFKRVAQDLEIPLKEVSENHHKLLKILHTTASSKIALPMDELLMETANNTWQTLATIPPMCKRMDKKYYVPSKGAEFLFTHPPPNSLIIEAAHQRDKQTHHKSHPRTRTGKGWICLASGYTAQPHYNYAW